MSGDSSRGDNKNDHNSYDATGNRLGVGGTLARTLVSDSVPAALYDPANRQLTFGDTSLSFDDNGNLVSLTTGGQTTTYGWDARNRLTGIGGPSLGATFAYDALGRRASKTINGQTTSFVYDGLDVTLDDGATGLASYLRTLGIDEALARSDGATSVSYLADALGSTVGLVDNTGVLASTSTYAPFGDTAVSGTPSANPFQFTGRENDGTGLYYFRARYYDPVRSRFVSEDPIGLFAGSVNLYGYADQNPLRFTDPTGEILPVVAVGLLVAVNAGAWSAVSAEIAEWRHGASPQEVGNAGIAAAVGATMGTGAGLITGAANPVAGVAVGSVVNASIENYARRWLNGTSCEGIGTNIAMDSAIGMVGGTAAQFVPKAAFRKVVLGTMEDLHTLYVQRVPVALNIINRELTLARRGLPGVAWGVLSGQFLKPVLGGRK